VGLCCFAGLLCIERWRDSCRKDSRSTRVERGVGRCVEIDRMCAAKLMRDRAPVEILAVGSREAFWDDRRTIQGGITVRNGEEGERLRSGLGITRHQDIS
jgi:hypothetical protein